ncbi:hypothetical protein DYB32_005751 [Aphanomyces invadans]|uniref:CCHC-type domain-containing protein n=1 Tax=Aphanomyces invadans TaxID=157072 RepID=A0A3R7CZ76_9STRA|nr:hypothetical protein DYB32_005751 [Aphanomyces invadans]
MLDELMRALERDNQEWVLYEEGKVVVDLMVKAVRPSMLQWILYEEGKVVVDLMVKAVWPSMLQSAVKKQMQLQRNKPLPGYQMYGGVENEKNSSKPAKAPDSRGHAPKRPDEKRLDGGAGQVKPRPSDGVARPDAPLAPARKPAACLKCKSTDHKVTDCPKTTSGEAQALLAAQMQKWKDAREVRPDC